MSWGEHCDVCGWCDRPGACVWSVTCPKCWARPGQQCRVPNTARLEGLHAERWEAAGIDFRTWGAEPEGVLVFDVETPAGVGTVKPGPDLEGAQLIRIEDWDDLRAMEAYIAEAPAGIDMRVIDSLTDLQRRITEEVTA